MTTWICSLAEVLSREAYDDLAKAHASHGRLHGNEVYLTHRLSRIIWDAASEWGHSDQVVVRQEDQAAEAKSGADLELWFSDGRHGVGWLIQAKRLYPPRSGRLPPRYETMLHKVGKKHQARLLIDAAARAGVSSHDVAPLYWLYSYQPVPGPCMKVPECRCGAPSPSDGIRVASAHKVLATVQRAALMQEPFSFHRWSTQSTALPAVLCSSSNGRTPNDRLRLLAGYSSALVGGRSSGEVAALPDRIRSLLESPREADQVIRQGDEATPAAVTAVIDLR